MNISVQKQPKCQATLEVEIPSELVAKERAQLVQSFCQQAKIPGFRPGKAPLKVIEKRFNSEIKDELNGRLMDQAFREALKQDEDLKVIDVKWPDSLDFQADGSAKLNANLILAPEFTLPDYKGVEIKVPKSEVTDEIIEKEIDNLRQRNADYDDVEGRTLEEGDVAVIDYIGTCEGQKVEETAGQPVAQLEEGKEFWMRIDEDSFLPGFATQLVGLGVDETRTVTVTLQEDFPIESLREKDLTFEVTLTAVKAQKLPTDDELVAALMPGGSMDDIRETLSSQITFQMTRQLDQIKEGNLLDAIANSVDFDLPEDYIASETQGQADRLVEGAVRDGASPEQIQEQQAQIFETAGARAVNNLKVQFLLSEIAAAEKIKVPDNEMLSHITHQAKQAGKPLKAFIKQLQRERRLDSIRNQLLIGKTIDFLLEHANVIEVDPSEYESESANDD